MNIKDIRLKSGMNKYEVNNLISNWLLLEDDIYLGNNYKHNWKCKCGGIIQDRMWMNIRKNESCKCKTCAKNIIEDRYRNEVEDNVGYKYIKRYKSGDMLLSGKVASVPYILIKHEYCGYEYETSVSSFTNGGCRCGKCCQKYENSFAYHIEVELGEPLEKYWDFEKNTVNPYHIYKNSGLKVWIKCQNEEINKLNGLKKKDYHLSYEVICSSFTCGKRRCSYCRKFKIHPYDSFGYYHFDKVLSWHPDNEISPFRVACGTIKKYKFICEQCKNEWLAAVGNVHKQDQWCPICASSKGERKVKAWLEVNNINYIHQVKYNNLIGLGGSALSYDFYLPEQNILIEYQGEYHDGSVRNQSSQEFKRQQEHDKRKREYAKGNGIKLLEIWYYDFDNVENILEREILQYE